VIGVTLNIEIVLDPDPEFATYTNPVSWAVPPPPPPPLPEQPKNPNPRAMIGNTDAMDFIWSILLRIPL
jgi:hypothetical protein